MNNRLSRKLVTGLLALLPFTSLGEQNQETKSAGMYSVAASFFLKSSNYVDSANTYNIAAELYTRELDFTNSVNSYILSATVAVKAGKNKFAIEQYKKALNLAKERNVSVNLGELQDRLGNLLLEESEKIR